MIDLSLAQLKIVQDVLKDVKNPIFVFGSRAKGTAHRLSDLDLCIKGQISSAEVERLKENFEDSDLPFTVDIVFWDRISADFRASIENHLLSLPRN